jgi:hypothetical protein
MLPCNFQAKKKCFPIKNLSGDEEEEEGTNETDGDDLCKRIWGKTRRREREKERRLFWRGRMEIQHPIVGA